jgi:uncharacterized protein (DUF885 family)
MRSLRRALVALLVASILPAVSRGAEPEKPTSKSAAILQKAGDDYWALLQKEDFAIRIRLGLPVESFPNFSEKKARADASFGRDLLSRLGKVAEAELSHEDQLSFWILREEARELVEEPADYWLSFPCFPYSSPLRVANPYLAGYPLRGAEDVDRYVRLLAAYGEMLSDMQKKLRAQQKRGLLIARDEIPQVVAVLSASAAEADQSLFRLKTGRLAALPEAERARAVRRVSAAIEKRVRPPARELVEYLGSDEYRQNAPEGVGLSQYPGGKDAYAHLVRRSTTLPLTAEEIHRLGLTEMDKLNGLLDLVRQKLAFQGSRDEFLKFLKTDPRFFARTPDEVGERLMAAENRIVPKVGTLFGKEPKAPYGVRRLDPELEGALTFGYYQMPTATDPKGYYLYNGSNLDKRSLLGAGSLIAHELVPGHHFQLNLQAENQSLPEWRREGIFYTAFVEGWGEYASAIAGELGMYDEPYELAGRILFDMFLTSRLVVDTGLNALGWSRQKAMDYMRANTDRSDNEIQTETLRYACDMPAQALAYKIGSRKLWELRDRASRALGSNFDIRRYHDAILGSGAMPLDILEKHVDWFIAREKARK